MAKSKLNLKNPVVIIALILLALFAFKGKVPPQAIEPTATVERGISVDGNSVSVQLNFIGGYGKFGGIIGETIPIGYTPTGISSSLLGLDGTASGKWDEATRLYEVAFGVDNIANPYIIYDLTSSGIDDTISGTFAYGEGGPTGTIGGDTQVIHCTPDCSCVTNTCIGDTCDDGCGGICDGTLAEDCSCATDTCTGNTCVGVCNDFCVGIESPTCIRPGDLCVESMDVSNECLLTGGGFGDCTGSWTVTQNTDGDIDCDNLVANQELLDYITKWVDDEVSNQNLLDVITAWVSS